MSRIYYIKDFSFKYPYQKKGIFIKGEFEINKGDIVLLTGNSGTGKSTLLYALKGLIPEVIFGRLKGKILYKDENISELSYKKKLEIGLLFQNPNTQMINRTVFDELAFGLENLMLNPRLIKDKILNMAKEYKISQLLNRQLTTLSGGEKQKIAFLSIILTNPDVILFDEPTAFLDPVSAEHFIKVFKKIAKKKTIVIIEHNIVYLKNIITKILKVENNEIKQLKHIDWNLKLPTISKDYLNKEILKIENLSFAYKKGENIINNLSFTLYQNQIIGIKGENGAGKSTLLKLLAKLLKPNKGEITLHGKKNLSTKEYYKKIGLLLQNPENHFLYSKVEKETDLKNLELFGLEKFKEHNPFTLSEGEKRRLSMAIVLNNAPEIILMDEPTFGQDYNNKLNIVKILNKLKKSNHSFIIVSHDIQFLKSVCSKIYELKEGKLYET